MFSVLVLIYFTVLLFYVLDFFLNCSFLFTDKLLCLVVHEIDHGDPEECEVAEAKVEVAEVKVEVEVVEAKVEVEVAEVKLEAREVKLEARFREMMLQQWLLSDEVEEGRRVAAAMVM